MGTHIKAEDVPGKTVVTESGFIIGEVHGVLIDLDTWQVSDLQIKVEKSTAKEVGLKTPFFGSLLVLMETELIKTTTDQIIVSMERDALKEYIDSRKAEAKEKKKDADED